MATIRKVLVLIACFGSCVRSAPHNYEPLRYALPTPLIRPFRPRGLKVSIPHADGIQLFAFHGNINKPLENGEDGQLSQNVLDRDGEKWVFNNSTVKLQVGDKIYYRVIVVKDKLAYMRQNEFFEVEELEPLDPRDQGLNTYPPTAATPVHTSPTPAVSKLDHNQSVCVKVVLNLTQSLLDLQQEIDSLRETNDILRDMIEKHPDTSKTLTLDGVKVNDDHLVLIVQAIIQDKLHLPFRVMNVMRKKSGLVKFQVGSLAEKLEVIKAANRELKHSKFTILY